MKRTTWVAREKQPGPEVMPTAISVALRILLLPRAADLLMLPSGVVALGDDLRSAIEMANGKITVRKSS
jgi:hypothetical protein